VVTGRGALFRFATKKRFSSSRDETKALLVCMIRKCAVTVNQQRSDRRGVADHLVDWHSVDAQFMPVFARRIALIEFEPQINFNLGKISRSQRDAIL
jgi:hypothetical protein